MPPLQINHPHRTRLLDLTAVLYPHSEFVDAVWAMREAKQCIADFNAKRVIRKWKDRKDGNSS